MPVDQDAADELFGRLYRKARRRPLLTFKQLAALFYGQTGFYPPPGTALTPVEPEDWYRLVRRVPLESLYQKEKTVAR